ncbi:hypothetical protein [Roseivirga misakiensis]|uniref:Uncharacterized protein n=1 Tax=Roseivirga misakiensis TaxID=1563681 RepID=A0A1E5T4J1_9BACT|nr:hypothetical protein [Roseivirga misakiensis]OEK06241.1 hypothetical protein BFP71_00775 [Roseivirga misakiensis]
MREPTSQELKRLMNWPEIAKKKWRFYFIHGSIYRGIPLSIISYLFKMDSEFQAFSWPEFMLRMLVFMIFGLTFGAIEYRAKQKRYNQIKHLL